MHHLRYCCVAMALVAALAASGCERPSQNEAVRWEGGVITVADLEAHAAKLAKKKQFVQDPASLAPDYVLEHAVNMEMIIAEGLKRKLHLDPRIREEIHGFMSELFLKMLQEELVPDFRKEDITTEEMREYYERHKEAYKLPDLYALTWLRTDDREQAARLASGIRDGAIAFEAASEEVGVEKGRTEARALERHRPEWRSAIASLDEGGASLPVICDDGAWVLRLDRKTVGRTYGFEEREAYIRNDVLYAKYRNAWEDVYQKLRRENGVQFRQEAVGRFAAEFAQRGRKGEAEAKRAPVSKP